MRLYQNETVSFLFFDNTSICDIFYIFVTLLIFKYYMLQHYKKYILIILLHLFCVKANAVSNFFSNHSFYFINEENGLPNNCINFIFKDSAGYIWLATNNGISRYDGYQFLNFTTHTAPISLKSNYVNCISEDRFGRLWVATEEGLTIISSGRMDVVKLRLDDVKADRLFDSYVQTVYSDRNGNMWVASCNNLWCLKFNNMGRISECYSMPFITRTDIYSIIDFGDGVCAGLDDMVYRIEPGENGRLRVESLSDNISSFSDDWRILCLCQDKNLLWIGTNRGLFKYDTKRDTVKRYRYSNHKPDMLSQAYITDVEVTASGSVLVSTLNGLNVYDRERDCFNYVRQNYRSPSEGVSCNRINTLFCDGEDIWVGTQMDGVNILVPDVVHPRVWKYNYSADGTDNRGPNAVNGIAEDRDGNIWLATADGGVNRMTPDGKCFENFMFEHTNEESISNNAVSGILIDSHNHLWAYTWGVGINELDLNVDGNRTFLRHEREDRTGLESDFLGSAAEDRLNDGIWFGSTRGLHFYDRRTRRFVRILFSGTDNDFKEVRAMMVDDRDRLWWGTSAGVFVLNLSSFDKENGKIEYKYMRYKLTEPCSHQIEKINCVMQDSKRRIWLGSEGNGLYMLKDEDGEGFEFVNYDVTDGLSGNTVIGMVEDADGVIWMSTNRGISSLSIENGVEVFASFTREDGLPDNRFNWNAYHYSSKNNLLYFGMMNELIAFSPFSLPQHMEIRKPVITSWRVAGGPVHSLPDRTNTDDYNRPEAKLHASDRGLMITFSTLDYANSHRIKYSYRLMGYDDEWVETSHGGCEARYSFLPDGEYLFQLRATDERGHWVDGVTEMRIVVAPYFYRSWWFYVILVVMALGVVKYVYKVKTEMYRKQKRELEQQVAERTSELNAKNRSLTEMALKVEKATEEKMSFFTSVTHEFRTPVTLIDGPLKIALGRTCQADVREQLEIASRSADTLMKLVNELLDFRKFDADSFVLVKKNIDFVDFVKTLIVPFEVFAAERNIRIEAFYRMNFRHRMFDGECLRKVIVNLLSNAVKFTPPGGKVSVYVFSVADEGMPGGTEGGSVCVDVRDSGCGINPDDTELIFQRFYQSRSEGRSAAGGFGIGLYLCRRIVEMHGGKIYAGNNRKEGAFVRLILPLEQGSDEVAEMASDVAVSSAVADVAQGGTKDTVLLVDDVKDMRQYLCTILSAEYNVLQASDGKEALEVLVRNKVDLVISDLMMPVMDGNELSRRIKSDVATSHIPLLLLTAIKSDKQEKMSLQIGVDDYLCKPFDSEILLLKVRNILAYRRQVRKRFASGMEVESLDLKIESKDNVFMRTAMELMKAHYMDSEYGVDAFVKDMGYSKTLVNSKLHAIAGMAIGQFMKEFRLNQARAYISVAEQTVTVADVAYAVGFNDPKYFTKCFKELFGVLPSEIMKYKEG